VTPTVVEPIDGLNTIPSRSPPIPVRFVASPTNLVAVIIPVVLIDAPSVRPAPARFAPSPEYVVAVTALDTTPSLESVIPVPVILFVPPFIVILEEPTVKIPDILVSPRTVSAVLAVPVLETVATPLIYRSLEVFQEKPPVDKPLGEITLEEI